MTGSERYAGDDPNDIDPNTLVVLEDFAYAYDPIGNRTDYVVADGDPKRILALSESSAEV